MRRLALVALALLAAGCGGADGGGPRPAADDRPVVVQQDPALHAALPSDVRSRGVLRVATDAAYPPASSFADDGRTIIGFEPDLGAALGRVLGVQVRFHREDFDGILRGLEAGSTDAVMAAMTDTPERERRADFVNYFSAGTAIVVQRGNPAGITDLVTLCGRAVAVERSTVQVDLLRRSQRHCRGGRRIRVETHPTNADALMRLRTGRVVAVLNDYPPAAHLVASARTRTHFQLASTTQYEPGVYGIAVSKDARLLRDALRRALDALIRSGAYAQVLRRWGVMDGAVRSASVNAGGGVPAT